MAAAGGLALHQGRPTTKLSHPCLPWVAVCLLVLQWVAASPTTSSTTPTVTSTSARSFEDLFPNLDAPELHAIPRCATGIEDECFLPSLQPMGWQSAHAFCRSKGGFLVGRDKLWQIRNIWPPKNLTWLESKLTKAVDVLTSPVRNLTLHDLTWTALTHHEGHYQWMSRSPAVGEFVAWSEEPHVWNRSCAAFHLHSQSFRLHSCDDLLRFYCLMYPTPLEVELDSIELRVTVNMEVKDDWVRVREEEFSQLSLTCTAHHTTTGLPLTHQPPIFWSKDGVYINSHTKVQVPAIIHDSTKSSWTEEHTHILLKQGTFWCEAWVTRSVDRLVSNKVLVTLDNWLVLILTAHRYEAPGVTLQNSISDIRHTFAAPFNNYKYTIDPISVFKKELGTANVLAKYRFQVHIPGIIDSSSRVLELFQIYNQEYEKLYEAHGYLNSSSAALSTYCLNHTVKYNNGNHIKWPLTRVGKANPLNYRCEIYGNRLQPGHCRWNYTHGATIDFDPSRCKRFDYCPHNYISIADHICLSFTNPDSWEIGFNDIYKNGYERSILDSIDFHKKEMDGYSVYDTVKQFLGENMGYNQVWLPVKRLVPWGPLTFLGAGASDYPYYLYKGSKLFNISWAQHHPNPDKDCLALDIETDKLLTRPCENTLPFIGLLSMHGLKKIPDPNWKQSVPELIVNASCDPGWHSTGLKIHQDICYKMFLNVENSSWGKAKEFCERNNAQLPTPGVGFLDWVYRQYLYDQGVDDVWMSIEPLHQTNLGEENSGVDMINWKADTDYSLQFTSLTVDGWSREEGGTTKTNILCQKVPPVVLPVPIQVHSSEYTASKTVCVDISHEGRLNTDTDDLKCFMNGRLRDLKSGNSLDCLYKIEQVSQGSFYCQAWMMKPFQLVHFNILINRKPQTLTFAVSLSQETAYIPRLHDATFNTLVPQRVNSMPCVHSFIRKLKVELEKLKLSNVLINADNFFYSVDVSKKELSHNFLVEFEFIDNKAMLTEGNMFEMFEKIFATKENFSDCSIYSIKSTVGCVSEVTVDYGISIRNLTWPKKEASGVVLPEELCVTEGGEPVTRECVGDFLVGYQWKTPSGNCTEEPSNITKQLWEMNRNNSSSSPDAITTLSILTANGSLLKPVDIHLIATKFQNLTNKEIVTKNDLEKIVDTLNNVMEADDKVFESVQNRLNSSSILFEAFENITFKVKLSEGDENLKAIRKHISVECLDLEINSPIIGYMSMVEGQKEETVKQDSKVDFNGSDAAIIFPRNLTHIVATNSGKLAKMQTARKKLQLTFAVYRTSKLFQDHISFPNHSVNSHIIQATYNGQVVKDLKEPIKIFFRPNKQGNDSKCVYWDFTKNSGRGGWSNTGCWEGEPEGDLQVCFCNHLTCFAQLINYNDDELEGVHALALDIITIIGCCLSIVSLLLVFTTFLLFKKWRRSLSNKILVNLSLSVFCSIVIFLAGINQTWNVILCRSVAVALHYFILASFGWMLVEAVHQYLKFVKVVGTYIPRFMWKASVSAWGAPVLPIIVVLVYDSTLYDSGHSNSDAKICWMSSEGFMYAFLPPLVLTMTVNLIMFCLIIYGATCGRVRVTSTMSDKELVMSQLKMAICVFFLLGFTWIFGILAIWKGRLLFSYLFCIFNTLQGFFLFLFHVFRERSARRLWKEFLSVIEKKITSSEQINSQNINNSMQYKNNSNSVTFNQGREISINPRRSPNNQGPRGSVQSARTISSFLHSRASFNR
ncbi:uncharacterized protein LOC121862124 isoform X2 [Homarus americanus]|uniref:uncharacterized protein LOC121862124 isoform X2 n=1 Tax=Homarus americanus TaxID=6706 RepID=UPI001C436820|nr:uncharacterized protein LOC121862124 isoform X2 [Homarus americanus]